MINLSRHGFRFNPYVRILTVAIAFGAALRAIAVRYPLQPSGHPTAGVIAFSAGATTQIAPSQRF
ncbi:MAG: hypothetical protein F6J89_06920 [Symploca sp. SIO1C4]|uniref:Uncharacterized protein n=1 Tax=Symploca sp. SIO1C4 TaxID=2607765 RepID=A0A6B3N6X3_9CYAN|nr:hypothetical protein [Symploca sp. SIO1C4]